jgi:DNA-binding protein H-NS
MHLAAEAIRFLMKDKEADLSKEDIGSTPTAIPRTPTRWSGRGRMPLWLGAEIKAGKDRDDFLIA